MTESVVRDEILESIHFINESVEDSVISVYTSIINEYDKISTMMDNAEDDWMFVQEGQIWDTATGKDKVESNLMKLIAFIPRLFQGIFNAIVSLFKKNPEDDITKNAELAKNVLAISDSKKLQEIANGVSSATNDQVGFDPKKKEFVFKRGFKHFRNYIFILLSLPQLFRKFIIKLKGGETQYDAMLKELKEVLKGNKELDAETYSVTIDTLHEMCRDGYKGLMGVRGITSEISMLLEKKMRSDFEKGKNIEKQAAAKNFLDEISGVSKIVLRVTTGLNITSKALYHFGGPAYRKLRKGAIDTEDIERQNDRQEKRDLKNKLKALKEQYKNLKNDKKRKDAKREEILKLEEQIKDLERKISGKKASRDRAAELDKQGDEAWNNFVSPDKPRQHGMVDKKGNEYDPTTKRYEDYDLETD